MISAGGREGGDGDGEQRTEGARSGRLGRGGGGVNARDPGSRIMRRRGLETAAQWMMGGEKEPPTELATTWAVTGEKMFGAGGEGAERVNARRGKGKGEPMRLSYFHTF
jgi:hypothetical protein